MKYQIHRTVVSNHEVVSIEIISKVVSNGKVYREEKEMIKVIENSNRIDLDSTTIEKSNEI